MKKDALEDPVMKALYPDTPDTEGEEGSST